VAFAFSFALIQLARRFSAIALHRVCLTAAGVGLLTVGLWHQPVWLLLSMAGVGVGWASILSMPYALLANAIPPDRMGFYMGVFNFFIVLPQIVAAAVLGPVVDHWLHGHALPVVLLGGASMLVAAAALAWVKPDADQGPDPDPSSA
jgi:maltose/moltooligosaccharide transporter